MTFEIAFERFLAKVRNHYHCPSLLIKEHPNAVCLYVKAHGRYRLRAIVERDTGDVLRRDRSKGGNIYDPKSRYGLDAVLRTEEEK